MIRHRLRDVITIQEFTVSRDATTGQVVESWSNVDTVRARVESLSGKEWFSADQRQSSVTTRITIRYMSGIIPSMRAVHGQIVYNIRSILGGNTSRDAMFLMCERAQ